MININGTEVKKITLNGVEVKKVLLDGTVVFDITKININAEKAKLTDSQFIVELEPSKLVKDNIHGSPSFEKVGSIYFYYPYNFSIQSKKYSWYADVDPQIYLKQTYYTNGNITASGSIRGAIISRYSLDRSNNFDRASIYIWDKITKRGDLKIGSTIIQKFNLEYYNIADKAWISLGAYDIVGNYAGRINYNYREDVIPKLTDKQLEILANVDPILYLRITKLS